jgi:hypothetical protein
VHLEIKPRKFIKYNTNINKAYMAGSIKAFNERISEKERSYTMPN